MDKISISKFYEQFLSNPDFQDPATGNLFFPAYIFTYNPEDEYKIRKQIHGLKEKLKRPNNFIDSLVLNIFDVFIEYLKQQKLGTESLFELILQKEDSEEVPERANRILRNKANDIDFFNYINDIAVSHFSSTSKFKKVYLMLYGFGSIFPFLRTSHYLKNFEKNVTGYKLITFYPGGYEDHNYQLFNELNDENIYRVTLI